MYAEIFDGASLGHEHGRKKRYTELEESPQYLLHVEVQLRHFTKGSGEWLDSERMDRVEVGE